MKKSLLFVLTSLFFASCGDDGSLKVLVTNTSSIDRVEEIVEITLQNPETYVVYNEQGEEIVSQATYDKKLIFPATVKANNKARYTLKIGEKSNYDTIACGALHPEFHDDLAWENNKIGFRASGKPQLKLGKYLYGYDIFTKRVAEPVLDELYDNTFGKETRETMARLRKIKPDSAGKYMRSRTYHLDHGKGMDYYLVGPTLGCGAAALVVDGVTQYPLYYDKHEYLDNGPLRMTLMMEFDPVKIGDDEGVVEKRIITLDANTHFNKIKITYKNLSKPTPIIAGVVLRDEAKEHAIGEGYLAYAEPAQEMGQTYDGVIFPSELDAEVVLFDEEGRKAHGGAFGHIQTEGIYTPNKSFTYYAGAGWNKWLLPTPQDWFDYVAKQQQMYAQPLQCFFER